MPAFSDDQSGAGSDDDLDLSSRYVLHIEKLAPLDNKECIYHLVCWLMLPQYNNVRGHTIKRSEYFIIFSGILMVIFYTALNMI